MAFVPSYSPFSSTSSSSLSSSFLSSCPLSRSRNTPIHARSLRMQTSTDSTESTNTGSETKDSPVFGKAGKSMWKESVFTGGFPGGEAYYKAWAEDGMTKDVPDVPESMQSKNEFKPKKEKKGGVLGVLDGLEYFKGYENKEETKDDEQGTEDDETIEGVTGDVKDDSEAPDPKLYEMYYPEYVLNKAPEIKFVYEGKPETDNVSVAMTQVEGNVTDLYFPRERKNKAPIIQMFCKGDLKNAYVSLKMDVPEAMVVPNVRPAKKGEVETTLVKGNSGGLKLQFTVDGQQF